MFSKHLKNPGPRPPFYEVTRHVFGDEHEVDTDGDSHDRDSREWTELYAQSRENHLLKLEIEPAGHRPLILRIAGSTVKLVDSAASFLIARSGGDLLD